VKTETIQNSACFDALLLLQILLLVDLYSLIAYTFDTADEQFNLALFPYSPSHTPASPLVPAQTWL